MIHFDASQNVSAEVSLLVSRLSALLDADPNPYSDSFITLEKHKEEMQLKEDEIRSLKQQLSKRK